MIFLACLFNSSTLLMVWLDWNHPFLTAASIHILRGSPRMSHFEMLFEIKTSSFCEKTKMMIMDSCFAGSGRKLSAFDLLRKKKLQRVSRVVAFFWVEQFWWLFIRLSGDKCACSCRLLPRIWLAKEMANHSQSQERKDLNGRGQQLWFIVCAIKQS